MADIAMTVALAKALGGGGGGGGDVAKVLIAANNSEQDIKDAADFVCSGVNDQIIINSLIESRTNEEICLLPGDYYISGEINPISNTKLSGIGNAKLHLANRTVTTLKQAVSVNDKTIYLTDPSGFIVGQKIGIKYGNSDNECDYNVGHIKTIDYETGAVTMYSRNITNKTQNIKEIDGFVNHSADAGALVFTDSPVIMGWAVDNVTICDLAIDGNSENLSGYASDTDYGSNLIEFWGGDNIRIKNNKLDDCYKHSVLFVYGTSNSAIIGNKINNALTHGIDLYTNVAYVIISDNILTSANIQCHGGSYTIISDNLLTKCGIYNSNGARNLINGNLIDNKDTTIGRCITLLGTSCTDTEISNNVCIGSAQGIQIDSGKQIKLSGNKFIATRTNAIHLYNTQNCVVDNNDVNTPNTVTTGDAIKIESGAINNIITGNKIYGTIGKTTTAINEVSANDDYNIIANNEVFNCTNGIVTVGTHSVTQNNIVIAA